MTFLQRILSALPRWLARRGTFSRFVLAVTAGGFSALGFAPFGLFPLLLAGLGFLVLLIDVSATRMHPVRSAALAGWGFGFGQFAIGLHWIGFAFMVDAGSHAWQLPFVAVLFPGALALFIAVPMALVVRLWRPGASRVLLFALGYGFSEWLRGHIFTGFPWNIAGYGWGGSLAMMQSTALFGIYGLSLLTVLFGASLALLCEGRWRQTAVLAGLFLLFFIGGCWRLASVHPASVPGVRVRLVQPDIAERDKYRRDKVLTNWLKLTGLSTVRSESGAPTVVIWPEAAPPFLITPDSGAMEWISSLNARGATLLTGAIRADDRTEKTTYFNSILLFAGGRLAGVYDKSHLVPFGEYLPFEETLNAWGLQKLTGIAGSFGRGDGPHVLALKGAPAVGPLICYEILFPDEVVGDTRPGWFANVTDDAWFGGWAGPEQHLLIAQTRAIEQGVPVMRAANTGISAAIDPLGRIIRRLGVGQQGVIDAVLPSRVDGTLYSRSGAVLLWGMYLLLLAGWTITYRRK